MLLPTLFAVAEQATEEGSKTPFYVVGAVFAAWAVLIGVIGATRPAFPHGQGGARIVMTVSVALALLTMTMAVLAGT